MRQNTIQQKTDAYILSLGGQREKILLHCCCAPCSSYVLEYLSTFFDITAFFFNPNLFPEDEYLRRKSELKRLISEGGYTAPVHFLDCDYSHGEFLATCGELANEPEGGSRCLACYTQRLRATAKAAHKAGIDLIATTLTISPLKSAVDLNRIGEEEASKYGVRWLPSDFKKKGGYQRSIQLSKEHGLYRQNYCGCEFSKRDVTT